MAADQGRGTCPSGHTATTAAALGVHLLLARRHQGEEEVLRLLWAQALQYARDAGPVGP